jgi:hypothetical protein
MSSLAPSPPPSGMDTIIKSDSYDHRDMNNNHHYGQHQQNLINPATLAYTPPASSPAEMPMDSHTSHSLLTSSPTTNRHPYTTQPEHIRTPSLEPSTSHSNNRRSLMLDPSLALHSTPPTSPLLCSTTSAASSSIISATAPADDLLSFDALGSDSSILIHGDTSGMDVDAMGISFHGGVSGCGPNDCEDAFSGSLVGGLGEFLKGEVGEVGNDSSFGLWDI